MHIMKDFASLVANIVLKTVNNIEESIIGQDIRQKSHSTILLLYFQKSVARQRGQSLASMPSRVHSVHNCEIGLLIHLLSLLVQILGKESHSLKNLATLSLKRYLTCRFDKFQ